MTTSFERVKDQILESLRNFHNNGIEYVGTSDLLRSAALQDNKYLRRREFISNTLAIIGIQKPIIPHYPRAGRALTALIELEDEGIIETPPNSEELHPYYTFSRRSYRLSEQTLEAVAD